MTYQLTTNYDGLFAFSDIHLGRSCFVVNCKQLKITTLFKCRFEDHCILMWGTPKSLPPGDKSLNV